MPRKPLADNASFDITAMVDLVFMMNIYFLVSWIARGIGGNRPAGPRGTAGRGVPKRRSSSRSPAGQRPPSIWANRTSARHSIPYEVEWRLQAAAEEGKKASPPKTFVLLKAEKQVRLRDVVRVAQPPPRQKG